MVLCVDAGGGGALEVLPAVLWSLARAWGAVCVGVGGGIGCDRDQTCARKEVPVAPDPERWGQNGDLLTNVEG